MNSIPKIIGNFGGRKVVITHAGSFANTSKIRVPIKFLKGNFPPLSDEKAKKRN